MSDKTYAIALHGGAGTILRSEMTPEKEKNYTKGLNDALQAGYQVLEKGGSALDAVEVCVQSLEDCPLFNAGKGAVFNAQGKHEMDASIMDGRNRAAGAVAAIHNIQYPVSLARKVMENTDHVLLIGQGAMDFAQQQNIELLPDEWFYDEFRYQQWCKIRGTEGFQLDHDIEVEKKFGTVGAVALDIHGNLAAATSTGGMTNKKFGRVGDSPLIGCGTWADNTTCAISCTGSGEYFIRAVVAYDVAARMEFKNLPLEQACHETIHQKLTQLGGDGGLIALDSSGNPIFSFNTEGMYRAAKNNQGLEFIGIYKAN